MLCVVTRSGGRQILPDQTLCGRRIMKHSKTGFKIRCCSKQTGAANHISVYVDPGTFRTVLQTGTSYMGMWDQTRRLEANRAAASWIVDSVPGLAIKEVRWTGGEASMYMSPNVAD